MSLDAFMVIVILAAAVVLFSFEWVAPEVVAVVVLVVLTATGIITPQESFSGFSSSAVIAIGGLLVIGAGLVRSGAVQWMADRMAVLAGKRYIRLLLASTAVPGILSGFINIIAAVSIFIPAILRLARRRKVRAAGLLLPMAVTALLGANLSLIGASHNLVVNSILQQNTQHTFGFFEFAPLGVVLLLGGMLYALLVSKRLLGGRSDDGSSSPRESLHELIAAYELNDRLWEALVQPDSSEAGRSLGQIEFGRKYGLGVLSILRGEHQLPVEDKNFTIQSEDVLALTGSKDQVEALIRDHPGIELMGQPEAEKEFTWSAFDLVEVVVPPRSRLIGKTLRESGLRRKNGLTGIALWRDNRPYRTGVRDRRLQAGDGLLLFGGRNRVRDFSPKPDLLWLQKPRKQEAPLHLRKFAPLTASIFLVVIASATLNWLSVAVASLAGAAAMVIIGIMTPRQAYDSISWRTLILIGGMYPIGAALQKTGAAAAMADLIIRSAGTWGPVPALAAVGALSLIMTQPMHNAVAALIMTPIALQVAETMGAAPKAFALAVVVGASASFLMPVGHPAPMLVQAPGGYQNRDYLKYGAGMAVFVLAVIAGVIPLLWPLK